MLDRFRLIMLEEMIGVMFDECWTWQMFGRGYFNMSGCLYNMNTNEDKNVQYGVNSLETIMLQRIGMGRWIVRR
ncbi:hypothetical protein [Candidatus Hodgkinia cicadicola]|uniref:hypothetical protein n=1 Tax=Candidatus Hodgkinia cicadicola TaxID=573658 RepID=UPI0011BA83F7